MEKNVELNNKKPLSNTKILNELKQLLDRNFPNIINKIILFGSQIKKNAKKDSDYDILIILKSDYDWKFENKIQDTCWEIDYKYDILTDVKIISHSELNKLRGKQGYILAALHEGISI